MAKTLVEKEICDACGAEVRPGSVFCYNCGGAVSEEPTAPQKNNNNKRISDAWRGDWSENTDSKTSNIDLKTTKLKEESVGRIDIKPIEKPPAAELLERIEEEPAEKTSIHEEAKLKTAASLRRKGKSFQRRTVEVVWEEPESAPNKWFPIVAILLILLVLGIFYLALYLK
jgi:hypothetical protein